jgi:hypothetical protein
MCWTSPPRLHMAVWTVWSVLRGLLTRQQRDRSELTWTSSDRRLHHRPGPRGHRGDRSSPCTPEKCAVKAAIPQYLKPILERKYQGRGRTPAKGIYPFGIPVYGKG